MVLFIYILMRYIRLSSLQRGATPLYDAIGGVIQRAEETVACNKGGKAELPVIIIFTDGEENRSMQWDRESVRQRIYG